MTYKQRLRQQETGEISKLQPKPDKMANKTVLHNRLNKITRKSKEPQSIYKKEKKNFRKRIDM